MTVFIRLWWWWRTGGCEADLRGILDGLVKVPQLQVTRGPVGIQSRRPPVEPDRQVVGVHRAQEVAGRETFTGRVESVIQRNRQNTNTVKNVLGDFTHSPFPFSQSGFLSSSFRSSSSSTSAFTARLASACFLSHWSVRKAKSCKLRIEKFEAFDALKLEITFPSSSLSAADRFSAYRQRKLQNLCQDLDGGLIDSSRGPMPLGLRICPVS